MNFNLIKEKYPKAFSFWIKSELSMMDVKNDRHLYDFFDEQGICIAVYPFFNHFIWKIHLPETLNPFIDGDRKYDSRTEAEEQAFLKAFEILENKLLETK